MFGTVLRISGFALAAWFVMTSAYPAISEAWKVRQGSVEASLTSGGLSRSEATSKALEAIKRRGVKSVTRADITAERDGDRWIVGASYEVAKPLFGQASLIYSFNVASNRKTLWIPDGE